MTTIIKRSTPGMYRKSYHPVFRSFHTRNENDHRKNFAPLNIIENDNVYSVELNLAGWKKDEIDIRIEDETLIISGEKTTSEEDANNQYHLQEYSNEKFRRSVILTDEVDQEDIEAKLEDGILRIELKKIPEDELQLSKKIEIR